MDTGALIALAIVVLALGVAALQAITQGRELERLHELTAAGNRPGDLEARVRELVDRASAAEWAASQSAAEMEYLGDLIGVGLVRLDDRGRIDFANAAAHAFLGLPPGTMLRRTALEAFVDERIDGIATTAHTQGRAAGEVNLRDVDARTVIVRGRRSPIRGTWLVLDDVSELRRLQQIRAEFIDNLSHELRTPLTSVRLLAETLAGDAARMGSRLSTRMHDRIDKIEIETGHLVQMVTELLDLSRIESGSAMPLLDDVDAGRLVETSVERLRLFAERAGVTLEARTDADLPSITGNEDRLGQVLVNLLHNAIKFSQAGGTVTATAERAGPDHVELRVADEGIGIPAAAQSRIFERFYKVDRARSSGGGTGLGLSIARHVVEHHGGTIRVASVEGHGATFTIRLPIDGASEEAASVRRAS